MKRFIGFVRKEFLHILRDKRTMLILFGLPIAQIIIFGYVVTNDLKDIRLDVVDLSHDESTTAITDKIFSSGYFILNEWHGASVDAEAIFREGKVKQIVVFGKNFSEKLERGEVADVQLLADASDANTANLVVNYTSGIIYSYLEDAGAGKSIPASLMPVSRMEFNPSLRGVFMFVPGTMALILMLVSAMMTSISIAREKELGTMETLLASPLRPLQIILGKVTPYVALSFINAVTILILGYFLFGVPLRGSLVLLLAECTLFIFLALSLGIFISTVSTGQQMAMFISMFALMLPTLLLSGFIFPIENMPAILQWLSYVMPPRWFIVIIKNIMIKGTGFAFVWKETLVLTGMTVFFILLSLKNFKIRLS
jgi:ABC-2 type transport system permease protein